MANTPRFFDPAPLWPYLNDGWCVITPNSRLASRIRLSVVAERFKATGKPVEAPAIVSLKSWYEQQWQSLLYAGDEKALTRRILSDDQELLVWEKIISEYADELVNPQSIAQSLMQARRWLWQWQQDTHNSTFRSYFVSHEQQIALTCFDAFDQLCEQQGWLTQEARNSHIAQCYAHDEMKRCAEKVVLVGFAEMNPRDEQLMQSMRQSERLAEADVNQAKSLRGFNHPQDELLAAAYWIKQRLHTTEDRIALVVPDLTARRAEVMRILQQVIEPESLHVDAQWSVPLFNISAGERLGDLPIARMVILALRFAYTRLQRSHWQILLTSRYFSIASDDVPFSVALLEALAETRREVLEASVMRQVIQSMMPQFESAQALTQILMSVAEEQRLVSHQCSSAQWTERFRALLKRLGWPGRRGLQSIDYQQYQQIQSCFDTFSTMDFLLKKLTAAEAIKQFDALLQRQVFQPQSKDARVQVLGTLEAAGLQFDAMWLMGMDEMHWPPAPSPNPFLPLGLQQELLMPRSSAQRELALAKVITQQLEKSSQTIVASFCQIHDETHYEASPLLEKFPRLEQESEACFLSPLLSQKTVFDPIPVYSVEAGVAPRLSQDEVLKGGSAILTNQSNCPFKSFVTHRLQGQTLEPIGYVFDQREQGTLLHKALEEFWRDIPDQASLLSLDQTAIEQRCDVAIETSLHYMEEVLNARSQTLGAVLRMLEFKRIKQRLMAWIEEEKQRPPFVVVAHEKKVILSLPSMTIHLRADRIDQLSDGTYVVIDYKTGNADKPAQWLGERAESLQLPLYAVQFSQQDQTVSGLAFAKINAEKIALEGLGQGEHVGLSTRYQLGKNDVEWAVESWDALLQHWQQLVYSLADEFSEGVANISPLKPPKTCQYCDLQSVCRFSLKSSLRIDEQSGLEGDEGE